MVVAAAPSRQKKADVALRGGRLRRTARVSSGRLRGQGPDGHAGSRRQERYTVRAPWYHTDHWLCAAAGLILAATLWAGRKSAAFNCPGCLRQPFSALCRRCCPGRLVWRKRTLARRKMPVHEKQPEKPLQGKTGRLSSGDPPPQNAPGCAVETSCRHGAQVCPAQRVRTAHRTLCR